ncbi:MAG: amidohydrolase family protein [Balneolales bacterium]|nr:amidohydrolase family protein [Balneolales bacterium]
MFLRKGLTMQSRGFLKAHITLALLIFSMLGTACSGENQASLDLDGADEVLVFNDISLLTMESEQIKANQTVIVTNGRIAWVGHTGSQPSIPDDVQVTTVDGPLFMMPGLAEMHAHIPPARTGTQYMEDTLLLYLSQGITTIRGMLGEAAHLNLRERAASHEIPSPRIFTSGPSFNSNSISGTDQAREMVRSQFEDGYDLLKFHPGISLEQFEVITDEANAIGIEFSGHISHEVGLVRSLQAGKGSIDHLDRYMEFLSGDPSDRTDPPIIYFGYDLAFAADESLISEAARLTKEYGVWNVPTNTLLENVFNPDLDPDIMNEWPGMEFIPMQTRQNWVNFVRNIRNEDIYDAEQARRFLELRKKITLALYEANAGLMLGADAPQIFNPPGYSAHRELALLLEAGLSPFAALSTATTQVAKYLNESNEAGKIKKGYRADLLLLNVNPLENIPFHDHIRGVVREGNYFPDSFFDKELDAIRARVSNM